VKESLSFELFTLALSNNYWASWVTENRLSNKTHSNVTDCKFKASVEFLG